MKKTNYKTAELTADEFYEDIAYIIGKWSIAKIAKAIGMEAETLRVRAKRRKGEK